MSFLLRDFLLPPFPLTVSWLVRQEVSFHRASMAKILQKYKCLFLQSQSLWITNTLCIDISVPAESLVTSTGACLGLHWWGGGGLFWVKDMLFICVLCQEPSMAAPVCTLGNIFFVWAHSSTAESGSDSDSRIQPVWKPPPALARTVATRRKPRLRPVIIRDTRFALHRAWNFNISNLLRECRAKKQHKYFLFLSRLFLFSKGITIILYIPILDSYPDKCKWNLCKCKSMSWLLYTFENTPPLNTTNFHLFRFLKNTKMPIMSDTLNFTFFLVWFRGNILETKVDITVFFCLWIKCAPENTPMLQGYVLGSTQKSG